MNKQFKIFYRHPDGGFRYIDTVTLTGDVDWDTKDCLEEIFYRMQGEVWSPHGEARYMIASLGVQHTSMSIGDIARDEQTGKVWRVAMFGWEDVTKTAPCGKV